MHQFKAALFDLDGTLFDTEPQYSVFWGRMGLVYHPEIKDFHKLIKGTTLPHILDTYFPDKDLQNKITKLLDEWELNMEYPFINGAVDFIRDLRNKGVKCSIVTSSNEKKISCLRRKVTNLDSLFDDILTSEMFENSKPHPDCYILAAKRLNMEKNECVVFEDAYNGIMAGKNAGMYLVGLATTNPAEDIIDLCDYVTNDFTQLNYTFVDNLLSNNKI